ncbi:MAG: alanine racemase [Candidatus Harrisonbacteria bacterium CG10_big_fil_rev_8_21_14_0_10_38_8]|uniref:Alanine racemase n=1 Tax=Candidatus Harrisonbacteria bacterium CG10_big_fil_rev_8_21_14_0_10_38_8 TaxID=1974582 RepID=A0A2M6WKN9_9BACT|nr:MAG: alanine racemase [Candidatus Harrisonbacteria bacterium CG10_big_fil_rev_8_21_14_0_10_38_8]
MNYKVYIELDKKALTHNLAEIRRKTTAPVWAVVKSNAYGHGLIDFSRLADKAGVDGFCVDSGFEGVKLRSDGVKKPILVLGPTFSHHLELATKNKLIITLTSHPALTELIRSKHKPEFHIKLDTGMNRQGFKPNELDQLIKKLIKSNLTPIGVYSHLADAKNLKSNFTLKQKKTFDESLEKLKQKFPSINSHLGSSITTLSKKGFNYDLVRVGTALYGVTPVEKYKANLKPVLSLYSVISDVKTLEKGEFVGYSLTYKAKAKTRIAIVPVGYWHGVNRDLSNKGRVYIQNKRIDIIGIISMDLLTINLKNIKAKRNTRVEIIGKNQSVWDLAKKLNTSPVEFLTRINPLIYKNVK